MTESLPEPLPEPLTESLPEPPAVPSGDPDTAPFWDGLREGRLLLPRCNSCASWSFFPRVLCPSCHTMDLTWTEASGQGVLYSYTVAHRAGPAFKDRVPFTIGLIDLREGPRMMAELCHSSGASIRIGAPVRIDHRGGGSAPQLPCFVPGNGRP